MHLIPANIHAAAEACLIADSVEAKLALTRSTCEAWLKTRSRPGPWRHPDPGLRPGRPPSPRLVSPRNLPSRGVGSREGRGALLHAIAHIEFNAIDLAWDAVYRFRELPDKFYADWVRIAGEEARHFGLLNDYLTELGLGYGDFPAHGGLWEMAVKTAHDPLVRMALVPRVLEARGLDVTPAMILRFRAQGDPRAAEILKLILREEVGHVAVGSRWFRFLCRERGLEPLGTFMELVRQYMGGPLKGPFNVEARLAAGFDDHELEELGRTA